MVNKFSKIKTSLKQEKANKGHMYDIAMHLSDEDRYELIAAGRLEPVIYEVIPSGEKNVRVHGQDIYNLLMECDMDNTWAIVSKFTGVTYAVGGITVNGVVWLLCSRYISSLDKNTRKHFMYMLKDNLEAARKAYHEISNVVWSKNKKHIALLRHLGATFGEPCLCNGESFIPFKFNFGLKTIDWGG